MTARHSVLKEVSQDFVSQERDGQAVHRKPSVLARLARQFVGFGPKLPDPEKAQREPEGLVGKCPSLDVPVMVAAYAKGLYPEAQKWWAPAERAVSFPEKAHISQRVWRRLNTQSYGVTFDEDFDAVLQGCGSDPVMSEAFTALHKAGYAHSVEVWDRAGRLAGGLYGLAVGHAFFTEGLLSRERDAGGVGFVTLSCHLQHWGFSLNDGKRMRGQLSQLGFVAVPRFAFNGLLSKAILAPTRVGKWQVETGLDAARWNPKFASTGKADKRSHDTVRPASETFS